MKRYAITSIPLIKTQYILLLHIIHDTSISPAIGSIITKSHVKFVSPSDLLTVAKIEQRDVRNV